MLAPGTVIASDYQVDHQLAAGGMGTVYVVTQLSTGRKRVLKLMHEDLVRDDKLRERFVQEARVGSRIQSEHVVEVIAAGLDGPSRTPFLVMELLEGETLAVFLERRGAMPPAEVDELFAQLCHALGAAHAAGVVHRDVKPENVLVCATRRAGVQFTVKVLDFGIAKVLAEAKSARTSAMGTPMWMAPEQTELNSTVSPATDVWPLGLIVFRALTGVMYWRGAQEGGTLESVMRESLFEPLAPASRRAAELGGRPLPYGFDDWFARAVERDPARRFADASAAYRALHPILAAPTPLAGATVLGAPLYGPAPGPAGATVLGAPAPSAPFGAPIPPPPAPHGSRRPSKAPLWIALGALALGLVGGGAYLATRDEPKRRVTQDDDDEEPHPRVKPTASASGEAPSQLAPWKQDSKIPVSSDDPALGPKDAPVTVVVFSSYECKYCLKLGPELKALRARHGDKLRVVWKDFTLPSFERGMAIAALGRTILRAKGNDAYWRFHDFVLEQVGPEPEVERVQEALADHSKFVRFAKEQLELDDAAIAAGEALSKQEVEAGTSLGKASGVTGIPHSFVNGIGVRGFGPAKLEESISQELAAVEAARAGGLKDSDTYVKRVDANFKAPEAAPSPSSGSPPSPAYGKAGRPFAALPVMTGLPARGPSDAAVRMLAFFDFQCPFCHKAAITVSDLLKAYPKEVRLEYAAMPLAMHKLAMPAANLAQQAFVQRGNAGFWQAYDKLVALDTKTMSQTDLDIITSSLGLDVAKASCTATRCDHKLTIEAAAKRANTAGVTGTPTFVLNHRRLGGAISLEEMRAYVDWELAKLKAHVDSGKPAADYPAAEATRAGLLADLEIAELRGKGAVLAPGKKGMVTYKGTLADGTVFDSTEGKPPIGFDLVPGRLIVGFEEALVGMRVGGKRKVTIPAPAGYGAKGSPPKIPPNAKLTFEIELVEVK